MAAGSGVVAAWLRRLGEPSRRNALIATVVVLGGLGFLPQLAGPGYDAALVSGLVLPAVVAITTALEAARTRPLARVAVARGAEFGLVLAVVGFAVMLLHGLRVGFCDPSEGLWLYVLGPGFGALLAGVWGGWVGLAAGACSERRARWVRRSLAVVFALAGPLACILVSLYRFVTSPMVFAFDPFFGVFSGPLYDTVVNVVERLETYRVGTLATLTLATLAAGLWDRARERGLCATLEERPGVALVALAAGLASIAHSAAGPHFGHWSTVRSIAEALGGHRAGKRCDVIYPKAMLERDAELFTRDCDARLPQIEAFFGARGPERIRVFLFSNDAEKGWLMGASHTYIAKPWREEVYVQEAAYPHPVLSHELAHVIAGSFGQGPFRVAGPLGGIWPDPGRIEGFAVAAAPDETDDLTTLEWAASMQELGILPPLHTVFQLDFLSITASKAYTVAGAFVTFLHDRYGSEALRRWYGGAEMAAVFGGKDMSALERDFRAKLAELPVPERALLTAKARFEQAPFFERKCPRIVDRALGEASERLGTGDVNGAEAGFRSALGLDPNNVDARFGLAGCERKRGDAGQAIQSYLALGHEHDVPKPQAARALETSADIELGLGHADAARRGYTSALELVFGEDRRRTLEVKRLASEGTATGAIVELLIGSTNDPPGWDGAAPLLQTWSDTHPTDDVAPYLIGRNLLLEGRYTEALSYLNRSLSFLPRLASVRREAYRLRVIVGCALGADPERMLWLERALSDRTLPLARRIGLAHMAERCPGMSPAMVPKLLALPPDLPHDEEHAPPGMLVPRGTAEPPTAPIHSQTALPDVVPEAAPDDPSTVLRGSEQYTPKKPTGNAVSTCPGGTRRIPGGKFWVGAEPDEHFAPDESPQYLTELPDFCMDETEVTTAAFTQCVADGTCTAPAAGSILCNYGRDDRALDPINCVTWNAADAYCRAHRERLPSEVELEYVARGGEQYLKYPWGEASPDGHACWKHPGTCPVKSFPPGAFGLSDVSGNVWEWGSDWYGTYPWPPLTGYAKVYRGGSFSRRFEKWMHTRLRDRLAPGRAGSHLGFRCAATLANETCPFGEEEPGVCRHGVLDRSCPEGKSFNGVRCVAPDEPTCVAGWVEAPGHGCAPLRALPRAQVEDVQANVRNVKRARSPGFDADCAHNSRDRPRAFRYVGGSHAARNVVSRRSGCKNRDVGVGWNSACCP